MDTGEATRKSSSESTFIPIPLTSLLVDTVADFDLYLPSKSLQAPAFQSHKRLFDRGEPAGTMVLYRQKDLSFAREVCQRLAESHVGALYVDSRQERAYRRYVERHLGELLDDPGATVETKATLLYTAAHGLMQDVLDQPSSDDVVLRSAAFVGHAAAFMFSEQSALRNLMHVMSHDYTTYTHSVNVFTFSLSLAQRQGADLDTVLEGYAIGALLHDIGKSQIPSEVLNCPGALTPVQWEIMRKHPANGCAILGGLGLVDEVTLDVVRHHHEKLDGSGYPDGLRGSGVTPFVRITTIADIFDALTTERPYKSRISSFHALKLMKDEMADELDPELFRTFVVMVGKDPG